MMIKHIIVILLTISISACNSDNEESLPNNEFPEITVFSDFSLNDEYIYWEVRRGNLPDEEYFEDAVIARFDESILTTLTETQRDLLSSADTNNGFDVQCRPAFCPIYGVALLNDSVFIIESQSDMIYFFDGIDTTAELSSWLSISSSLGDTSPKYYEKNESGYRVILDYDDLCGTKGTNLIQVYTDGTVELIKELSTETYDGCVVS